MGNLTNWRIHDINLYHESQSRSLTTPYRIKAQVTCTWIQRNLHHHIWSMWCTIRGWWPAPIGWNKFPKWKIIQTMDGNKCILDSTKTLHLSFFPYVYLHTWKPMEIVFSKLFSSIWWQKSSFRIINRNNSETKTESQNKTWSHNQGSFQINSFGFVWFKEKRRVIFIYNPYLFILFFYDLSFSNPVFTISHLPITIYHFCHKHISHILLTIF